MKTDGFTFFVPTRIEFGYGKVRRVGEEARRLGMERVLVISDRGLKQTGLLDRILPVLKAEGLAIDLFIDVEADPDEACVEKGVACYSEFLADGLIAIGGGSSIDAAKAVGIVVAGGHPVREYGMGSRQIERPIPSLITVPTTAGTGSEVNRTAIITNREEPVKMAVRSPLPDAWLTSPRLCILDPELTYSLPRDLTIYTGLDALAHGVESLVARGNHAATKALSTEVIRLILDCLPRAAAKANDAEARAGMMQASALAGIAMTAGLGAAHALGHALGIHYHLSHGRAVSLMLPGVMAANFRYCLEDYGRTSRYLHLLPGQDMAHEEAPALIAAVINLMGSLQVPELFEINPTINVDRVVASAMKESFLLKTNAADLNETDLRKILMTPYREVSV